MPCGPFGPARLPQPGQGRGCSRDPAFVQAAKGPGRQLVPKAPAITTCQNRKGKHLAAALMAGQCIDNRREGAHAQPTADQPPQCNRNPADAKQERWQSPPAASPLVLPLLRINGSSRSAALGALMGLSEPLPGKSPPLAGSPGKLCCATCCFARRDHARPIHWSLPL